MMIDFLILCIAFFEQFEIIRVKFSIAVCFSDIIPVFQINYECVQKNRQQFIVYRKRKFVD